MGENWADNLDEFGHISRVNLRICIQRSLIASPGAWGYWGVPRTKQPSPPLIRTGGRCELPDLASP